MLASVCQFGVIDTWNDTIAARSIAMRTRYHICATHFEVELTKCPDDEALHWFQECARLEGILPALEPSHAIPRTVEIAKEIGKDGIVIMNMCGRGDKDVFTIADALGEHISEGTEG